MVHHKSLAHSSQNIKSVLGKWIKKSHFKSIQAFKRYGLARSYEMSFIFEIKNLMFEFDLDRLHTGCYTCESSNCLIKLVANR